MSALNLTDGEFMATTDRNLIRPSARSLNFSGRLDKDLEKQYASPIVEQASDRNENVQSTEERENVRTVGRDVHHDQNREQIHGMPDTG